MKISQEVIDVIGKATTAGALLTLQGQLSRPLYQATAKALEAAGGKWDRKAGGHVFAGDAATAIEPILLTGEITNRKVELQAFYTPQALAERVADEAQIRQGHFVLEPSAGGGALAGAVKQRGGLVQFFEIDQASFHALVAAGFDGCCMDFLATTPTPLFDRVVMNPPFTGGQDVDHVTHALKFLKPGGRLVSIMSPSWTFRTDRRSVEFRALLERQGGQWVNLPDGAFKEAGTMVRTVLVTVDA